jgi:hypothetical protein
MLKKTITYVDFNDVEKTETFYFNLTRAEITKMELSTEGGLGEYIKQISEAKDGEKMMAIFEKIILMSYGEKDPSGRFVKTEKLSAEFSWTAAYDQLFMELCLNPDKAAEFINGIVPKVAEQPKS